MPERLDALWTDLRQTMRALARAPHFALTTVLTLGLGIAATTVIFSLVDHIVLRPLPYTEPGRLVVVREVVAELRDAYPSMPANAGHYLEMSRTCTACEGVAAIKRSAATLSGRGDPLRVGAALISANLFTLLGIKLQLGRAFSHDEEAAGRDRVVILSHQFWQRRFGADSSIVGRTVTLDDAPSVVVGILPPDAGLPAGDALGALVGLPPEIDIYQPLALSERQATTRGEFDYAVVARLRASVTRQQAQGQLEGMIAGILERQGQPAGSVRMIIQPLQEQVVGETGRPLLLLLTAVDVVLLIVCVNLTNLTLARNERRQRDAAVRAALGAGRGRLARLALTESMILALIGGALAMWLATWGLSALVALAPASLPRIAEVRLDGRIFVAAAALTALIGAGIGLIPAIRMGRADPGTVLKSGGRTAASTRGARRRRATLIATQVAFSTVLLVLASLVLLSLVRVLHVQRGFDAEHVLALDVSLPRARYVENDRRLQFYERALTEASAIPGVTAVATTNALPLEGETWVDAVAPAERASAGGDRPSTNLRFVSPAYFAAVGTPLIRGRAFAASDARRPVVVISERTARTLWPGEDALGKRVVTGDQGSAAEVIGVAADIKTSSLEREGSLVVYLPLWAFPPVQGTLIVRTSVDPAAVAGAVRASIRQVDASVPVPRVRTMAQVVSGTVAARRFQLGLLALFGILALISASVGIYGVISQSLAGRRGEMGVRMALGARPVDVQHLVLKEGLTPVIVGLAVGLVAAMIAGRAAASLLFEVQPGDPLALVVVSSLILVVAAVACAIPARRASTMDWSTLLQLD